MATLVAELLDQQITFETNRRVLGSFQFLS